MGRVAVIYEGKYGSTQQYAQWLCEDTGADLFRLADCSAQTLTAYDTVVFGGAIHAGGILGIGQFKKLFAEIMDRQVYIFAVGLNVEDEAARKECIELNFEKQEYAVKKVFTWAFGRRVSEAEQRFRQLPCWFFRGAYDPAAVSGADRAVMRVVERMIKGKPQAERTASEQQLLDAVAHGADYTDRNAVRELADAVNGAAGRNV